MKTYDENRIQAEHPRDTEPQEPEDLLQARCAAARGEHGARQRFEALLVEKPLAGPLQLSFNVVCGRCRRPSEQLHMRRWFVQDWLDRMGWRYQADRRGWLCPTCVACGLTLPTLTEAMSRRRCVRCGHFLPSGVPAGQIRCPACSENYRHEYNATYGHARTRKQIIPKKTAPRKERKKKLTR